VIVVGLTGGIGSGKSTVSRMLARRGAVVIDADLIVHQLQQPGQPLLDALAVRFGAEILTADGALDRAKLAEIAFASDEDVADLNAIVHPAVRREIARRVQGEAESNNVVVLDIPLITERDAYEMAALVVVDAPVDVAVERMVSQRAMSEHEVRARVSKQISREKRRSLADRVIDNSGDLAALERQVDDVWSWMHTLPAAGSPAPTDS
jgi:dephospho-CoA kinase